MVGHTGYVLVLTSLLLVHPYMRLKRSVVFPTSEVLYTSTLLEIPGSYSSFQASRFEEAVGHTGSVLVLTLSLLVIPDTSFFG